MSPTAKQLREAGLHLAAELDKAQAEIEQLRATVAALYEWYDRDGSVGGASEVFEQHRAAAV